MSSSETMCEWGCGNAATREVEVSPARVGTWVGRKRPVMPRHVWVCEYHATHIEDDRGWQERKRWSGEQLGMGD